ncbi:hypothetical protein PIB30_031105 [Stylosanthes scabra]|uniref:Uncharacterized protein n=1 Tax=Stylosanthes scabra TaxID=79078 RepID=A0ABU6VDY8_9FABA|nr:hypothetical protein [Stylosanthes scabra]
MNVKAVAGIWDDDALVKNVVIRGLEIKGSSVVNVNHVEETQASDTENAWVEGESATEEFWDDDVLIEASESKKVWDKGRIFFDSSGEEGILKKLTDRKVKRKKQWKKRQRRKPPCIQGRTLATRKLRLVGVKWVWPENTKHYFDTWMSVRPPPVPSPFSLAVVPLVTQYSQPVSHHFPLPCSPCVRTGHQPRLCLRAGDVAFHAWLRLSLSVEDKRWKQAIKQEDESASFEDSLVS